LVAPQDGRSQQNEESVDPADQRRGQVVQGKLARLHAKLVTVSQHHSSLFSVLTSDSIFLADGDRHCRQYDTQHCRWQWRTMWTGSYWRTSKY